MALVALALWGLLSGCESSANRDMKRAQDRAAIQLSYAQRDRDEYKAQVDKLQAALADSQAKHTLEQQQVAALRADLQRAQDASLEAQKSQAEANRLVEENKALNRKLADARAASAVQASSPTTMPNK
jgi:predicted RNase H-like nuclease (RuvC/YqgF family)